MPLSDLTQEERRVVKECLQCVASGEVIEDDWEFETLFGFPFVEIKRIAELWPLVDESDELVRLAVNNSLNNLLGYPHGQQARWNDFISVPRPEVARVLQKWRGDRPDAAPPHLNSAP